MKINQFIVSALIAALAVSVGAQDQKAADGAKNKNLNPKQTEARALRMVKNAATLFESGEDERAISMLEAVPRMYPDSAAKFKAYLELGRHYVDKRVFDKGNQALRSAIKSQDAAINAEGMLLQGQLHLARGEGGEAVMVLRRLTQDYPTSEFANDAFFLIGQTHFEAGRWTRASEAFLMVGTAVPEDDSTTNETVLAEAGQRIYVHVRDKDLSVIAATGGKTMVQLESPDGDQETVQLTEFGGGNGDFLASVETTPAVTKPGDGKLTVHGAQKVKVTYVDVNDENGKTDIKRLADASIVSSGTVTFMDGAQRQKVKGVFVDQPAFIRLKDLDLDTSVNTDRATVVVKSLYRERPEIPPGATVAPPPAPDAPWLTRSEVKVELVENGSRTGVFAGRIVPRLLKEGETNAPALPAGEIAVMPEDKLRVEYSDVCHLRGTNTEVRTAEVHVLVGASTEPQSIVAHASEATVQAKKLLLEGQLLCQWGRIFKDTGLDANAMSKAEEGLERVAEILQLAKRFPLERSVVEDAYQVKWSLELVQGDLNRAIRTCHDLVRLYPDTALADRAFIEIGKARASEKNHDSLMNAVHVFSAVTQLPNSSLKAEAQFRIGEAFEEMARLRVKGSKYKPDFSQAMTAFKNCAESYPNSSYAGEAFKRVIDYYISVRDYPRAIEVLERVFQDYVDAPWLDDMLLKWGVVCHRQGKREEALEKFHRIVEEYPGGTAAKQASTFIKKLESRD